MCGIAAHLSRAGPADSRGVSRALRALRHRGPDGSALYAPPGGPVALGLTRLAILAPEEPATVISNEDGSIRAVVNGEFYGFEQIRAGLESQGHRFGTRLDSEVLIHLYEERGFRFLDALRGEFAFVLWDSRSRLLLAARDRFGIKPLCYAVRGGELWLASEAKALFAAGLPAEWDAAAVYQALQVQYLPPSRTLFAGVRQVPPGHLLLAMDGEVQVRRYWDLDYPVCDEPDPGRTEADWVEQVRHDLSEAVRLRLRADVPVACVVSGGIDSSSILGLAARESGRAPDAFTVGFDDAAYDESSIAAEMAARVGGHLHHLRLSREALLEALPDAVCAGEGLAINGHLPAKYLLSRVVRDAGYRVVLTGEGADELFAGYAHLRRDLWLHEGAGAPQLEALVASNTASAGTMLPWGESLPLGSLVRTLGFVPAFLEAKGTLGRRAHALLSDDFLREFADSDPFHRLLADFDVTGQLAGRHPIHQSLYLWNRLALSGYILRTLGDGTEMAHSVEGRVPFLDHHLFESVRQLPPSLLIRGATEKYILREAVRPWVTPTLYHRQKHPFLAPPLALCGSRGAYGLVQDTLRGSGLAAFPFFDRQRVLTWLDSLTQATPEEQRAADPVLMLVLCAALLQEHYRPGASAGDTTR